MTSWDERADVATSVFPDAKRATFLLPVKQSVRRDIVTSTIAPLA
jgi:hypothetical protein